MKYSTILPAFLFLAGSALLPISSYAGYDTDDEQKAEEIYKNYDDSSTGGNDDNDGSTGGNDDNDGSTGGNSTGGNSDQPAVE